MSKRQSISTMDECLAEFIKRMILRMPRVELMPTLKEWGFLTERELQSLDLIRVKDILAVEVVNICESRKATMKHAADLDIIYTHGNSKRKNWEVYQMSIQSDSEANLADVSKIKVHFKKTVQSVLKNVTIHFKEFGDALWIRIAWGRDCVNPNQYKPTFAMYHAQTPYVFVTGLAKTHRQLFYQGLLSATGYGHIQEMELKSRCLDSLKEIVFKQFSQNRDWWRKFNNPDTFTPTSSVSGESECHHTPLSRLNPLVTASSDNFSVRDRHVLRLLFRGTFFMNLIEITSRICKSVKAKGLVLNVFSRWEKSSGNPELVALYHAQLFDKPFQSYQSRSIPEKSFTPTIVDTKVVYENIKEKERVHHVMLESFGEGPLPKLEYAVYKLETSFKGETSIANKIEPFRCIVKFSSPHLLESFRTLAPSGLAEAPISNLLTCIPHRGRNLFKISEKKQPSSSQAVH